jgi:HD-like signal output (HDOD) protein
MDQIDRLMDRLKPESLPVFNQTVQQIFNITGNEDSSAGELARVILSDPSMTAHILQVANRVPYNPTAESIATVSQAVLVLGFESISRLSLTKALIDSLLEGNAQQYLLNLVSESLHAAVQAHALAVVRNDPSPEDVFIATLLMRIGDIALWSLSPELSQQVAELMENEGISMEDAQIRVFGCSGNELTTRLSIEWSLGSLLAESVSHGNRDDPRIQCIRAGEALARSFAEGGSAELESHIPDLQILLKTDSRDKVVELVQENTKEAIDMAQRYGLPLAPILDEEPREEELEPAEPEWLEPSPDIQLRILGEISELLEGKPDINLLLEMVVEGIYRGAGMDTVFFALLTPDRKALNVRFVLAQDPEAIQVQRMMQMGKNRIANECISSAQATWYPQTSTTQPDADIEQQSKGQDFFMKSITIGSLPIGLFYADRTASGRPMDQASFNAFRQFSQQANLGLSFLKSS